MSQAALEFDQLWRFTGIPKPEKLLWSQNVYGEPASKANSRIPKLQIRKNDTAKGAAGTTFTRFIKSQKAFSYERDFLYQVRRPQKEITENIALICRIYYGSRRSDLDESLIMDLLQKAGVIANDRQIRVKVISGFVDPTNPRAEIEIWRIF
ncbi:hypothetical protein L0152_07320 [bacterium]|nr:hypothetical protein [bacterium]